MSIKSALLVLRDDIHKIVMTIKLKPNIVIKLSNIIQYIYDF